MTALVDPLSMFRLDGKVALVTGGGSGIGRATAAALAGADAAVAILDIELTRAETAAREITTSGGAAHQADVTDKTSVERAIDAIVARHGGLDILVNGAGIGIRRAVVELPLSDWDKVVAVNLTGVFLCSQAAARVMLQKGAGAIVNLASIMGFSGGGFTQTCPIRRQRAGSSI